MKPSWLLVAAFLAALACQLASSQGTASADTAALLAFKDQITDTHVRQAPPELPAPGCLAQWATHCCCLAEQCHQALRGGANAECPEQLGCGHRPLLIAVAWCGLRVHPGLPLSAPFSLLRPKHQSREPHEGTSLALLLTVPQRLEIPSSAQAQHLLIPAHNGYAWHAPEPCLGVVLLKSAENHQLALSLVKHQTHAQGRFPALVPRHKCSAEKNNMQHQLTRALWLPRDSCPQRCVRA